MDTPNTQWLFVVTDLNTAEINGTNDRKVAEEFSQSEDYIVIEVPTCKVLAAPPNTEGGDKVVDYQSIPEQTLYKLEG